MGEPCDEQQWGGEERANYHGTMPLDLRDEPDVVLVARHEYGDVEVAVRSMDKRLDGEVHIDALLVASLVLAKDGRMKVLLLLHHLAVAVTRVFVA